jgi:flagellar motor protein MotB
MAEEKHDSSTHGDAAGHEQAHGKGGHGHKKGHGGGHGGGHEEGHEGAPEWLISFADNVALMMGFFVILLAMNMKEPTTGGIGGKPGDPDTAGRPVSETSDSILDMQIAIRDAFNNPIDLSSTDPADQPLIKRIIQRMGKSKTRDPGIEGYEQDVQSIRPSDYYAISASVAFAEGSSALSGTSDEVVNEIAEKVRGLMLVLEVRGHVSSAEAARAPDQAMQLASARALAVAGALASRGVEWWRMRLVICADHDRVESFPTGPHDDGANARVEVIITSEVAPDRVPTERSASAAEDAVAQPAVH